jgi:hypothetical protein
MAMSEGQVRAGRLHPYSTHIPTLVRETADEEAEIHAIG